jgi:hypothetical protein
MVHQIELKFFVCFFLTILLQRYEMSNVKKLKTDCKLIFQKSTADISPWLQRFLPRATSIELLILFALTMRRRRIVNMYIYI